MSKLTEHSDNSEDERVLREMLIDERKDLLRKGDEVASFGHYWDDDPWVIPCVAPSDGDDVEGWEREALVAKLENIARTNLSFFTEENLWSADATLFYNIILHSYTPLGADGQETRDHKYGHEVLKDLDYSMLRLVQTMLLPNFPWPRSLSSAKRKDVHMEPKQPQKKVKK